jgi:RNA polymerase sigma-70 factor (ECF subfamily)
LSDPREPDSASRVSPEGGLAREDLAAIRRGDPDAFERIAIEVAPRLLRFARHLAGRADEAEDLVQEVLVHALPALARFEGRSAVTTYLLRALSNTWKNRLRSRSRSRLVLRLSVGSADRSGHGARAEDSALDPADPAPSALEQLAAEERARAVRAAVARLDPDRRLVLLLRETEDLSYEEIAVVTGLPVGTVRSRLARARADLRQILEERR